MDYGVERGATPIGDQNSLVRIAAEVNEREKKLWLQKQAAKEAAQKQAESLNKSEIR